MSIPPPIDPIKAVSTREIFDSVIKRLDDQLGAIYAADWFPEDPDNYRVDHPIGAVLVGYSGAKYGAPPASGLSAPQLPARSAPQPRTLRLTITVLLRVLNGDYGAPEALDQVRNALRGFRPPGCTRPIWFEDEAYLGNAGGIWQYALNVATQTWDGQKGPARVPTQT